MFFYLCMYVVMHVHMHMHDTRWYPIGYQGWLVVGISLCTTVIRRIHKNIKIRLDVGPNLIISLQCLEGPVTGPSCWAKLASKAQRIPCTINTLNSFPQGFIRNEPSSQRAKNPPDTRFQGQICRMRTLDELYPTSNRVEGMAR
jgi:hypothetical protein